MANVFMGMKILGLSSIALIGISYQMIGPVQSKLYWGPNQGSLALNNTYLPRFSTQKLPTFAWPDSADFTDALFVALFANGGWKSVGFDHLCVYQN